MSWPTATSWSSTSKGLLVIHQGALGDFLLALPALWALHGAFSPGNFAIAGHPWVVEVLKGVPLVNQFMDVNTPPLSSVWKGERASLPFERAVVFSEAPEWSEGLRRAGLKEVWPLPPFPRSRIHMMDHHLLSLRAFGVATKVLSTLFLSTRERAEARRWLGGKRWLAVHPGAGSPRKIWPHERMAWVVKSLASLGFSVLVLEGPADAEAVKAFCQALGFRPTVLRYAPLRWLAALLSEVSLFLGNDSGVAHLAAIAGAPTLVLFGPTDPTLWAPRGRRVRWLKGAASCAPCTPEDRRRCPRAVCMQRISPEKVYTEALSLIK